jgi:CRISPR-associated protein Csb2
MGAQALLIEVRWPDGRFHGVREGRARGRGAETVVAEWPPSPFRLFQALVSGAYGGRWVAEDRGDKDAAFAWLEGLDPPVVSAPAPKSLRPVSYFVPNNDLDAKGGDPAQVANIRTQKVLRTSLFDADRPVAYLWTFDGDDTFARRAAELAGRLHTLGQGIDVAFAHAEVLEVAEAEARVLALGGAPHRPSVRVGVNEGGMPCPTRGSLDSLQRRHEAFIGRFERVGSGRRAVTEFRQPPKAHTRTVAYDRKPTRLLFQLTPTEGRSRFRSWPLAKVATLVVAVRDHLSRLLGSAWPDEVARLIVGKGAWPSDAALRLRIVPLPSIGMSHTDPDIRRVLVEIPPDHPIPLKDLEWALAGRELADVDGVLTGVVLTPTADTAMLKWYGVPSGLNDAASRVWRTVTPAALPEVRGRDGQTRAIDEARAAGSVVQALRHAGIVTPVTEVRIQREPFDLKGDRSDRFEPSRFDARDLRHVELTFARPIAGPLIIGNARWLGLGVMRTAPQGIKAARVDTSGLHVFEIEEGPRLRLSDAEAITRALRRAVMSRAQAVAGARLKRGESLPRFFTGHDNTPPITRDSAPARSGFHEHLFYGLDLTPDRAPRLLVIAPHKADRNAEVRGRTGRLLDWLTEAVTGLDDLRAGPLGRFRLAPAKPEVDDRIVGKSAVWTSLMPYRPTLHPKRGEELYDFVVRDLMQEAARRNLPRPDVDVLELGVGARGGIRAKLRLRFAEAIAGPILLGQGSHFGGGMFQRDRGIHS